MIIETSSNRFYDVTEISEPGFDHVWSGIEMKRHKSTGKWLVKKVTARPVLVRKAACRVVEA